MNKSMFGWSYPPGAANDPSAPYNQEEEPLDLREGRTIKGHGRGDGLNGKDADLDASGQNIVTEAWWFSDGVIRIRGRRYASIVPPEDATDEQMNIATGLVCDCGYPGEWDGDYWVIGEDYELAGIYDNDDKLDDAANFLAACDAAVDTINRDSKAFETEMAHLNYEIRTVQELDL